MTPLLSQILAFPEAYDVRLLHAMRLDENGHKERAEFIRLQLQAAAPWSDFSGECLPCNAARVRGDERGEQHLPCRCTTKWKRSWKRMSELAAEHGAKWADDDMGLPWVSAGAAGDIFRKVWGPVQVVFVRGFIGKIECRANAWLQWADHLVGRVPVRRVKLTTSPDAHLQRDPMRARLWPPEAADLGKYPWRSVSGPDELLAAEWPNIRFTLPPFFTSERRDQGQRADSYKNLGGPHLGGA